MVQLPATAAIEYVAAGHFFPGGLLTPAPQIFRVCRGGAHYVFHPSTIWVRPLFTELGPKKPPKKPILP